MEPEICLHLFPATHSPGGWGTEWTVGEIIAIGGTLNDVDRQRLEVIWHINGDWEINYPVITPIRSTG